MISVLCLLLLLAGCSHAQAHLELPDLRINEPSFRSKALAELRAAVAADPGRAAAIEALRLAEAFDAAESVDPAPPRQRSLQR